MTDGRANPYSPPARADVLGRSGARRSGTVAHALGLLVLLVSGLHTFRGTLYIAALAHAELIHRIPVARALDATWAVTRVFTLVVAVAFAVWIYRANLDARSLGARGMVFTPTWSVLTTFLPLVNLVAPFRAVREIYQASHPERRIDGEAWRGGKVTPMLFLWWALFLFSIAWFALSGVLLSPRVATFRQPVLELLLAASGMCFFIVVRRIDSRFETREEEPNNQSVSAA